MEPAANMRDSVSEVLDVSGSGACGTPGTPDASGVPGMSGRQLLALLELAVGGKSSAVLETEDLDWREIYRLAEEHTVLGIAFAGIEKMPEDRVPDTDLLMEWLGQCEYIKDENSKVNAACEKVIRKYSEENTSVVIIKGQATGRRYGALADLRYPGDIDAWVVRGNDLKKSRDIVAREVLKENPGSYVQFIHVDAGEADGVPVEVHFTPINSSSPFFDRRVQKYFAGSMLRCKNHSLPVDADLVHQLMHLRKHLINEGVGLRHVCDFYFTLKDFNASGYSRTEMTDRLKYLGVYSFACAMMYIMKESFGVEADDLLCPPDARRGSFIIHEIFKGGNFGRYNTQKGEQGTSRLAHLRYYAGLSFRCARYFPSESLWNPLYRIRIGLWRKFNRF